MKLDTSGIDQEHLARFIQDAYGLETGTMTFQPKGEASYSYLAVAASGARGLIKVQAAVQVVDLEARLRAVRYVQSEGGMAQVVAPRQNRWGDCTSRYGPYLASVYPFVDGVTVEPGQQTEAYANALASLLGVFHAQGRRLPFPIPTETFDNPFEGPILKALRTVEAPEPLANPTQERLRALLLAQRSNILTTLANMRQLTEAVRRLDLDFVLVHGDPNWANILVDGSGTMHLLDWDDLALGPAEHDLVFFSDRSEGCFEAFLRQYLAIHPQARLHADVFAFYHYRWTVQEIADYTTRILFRNVDPAEDEHAWAELQPYVPAPHADMASGVHRIEATLARLPMAK
jgi:Ser/Thr protein kinase RdoA (MazF antagonist)